MLDSVQATKRFEQALACHQKGQLAQAQALYEEVLAIDPNHVDALHLSGVAAAQTGDQRKAVDLIGKAIAIEPANAAFHFNRGVALNELKEFEAAAASFDSAIAIKPEYYEACVNRGNALNELNLFEEAVTSFDKAIAIKPDVAEAYFNRGNALKKLGKFNAAMASFDKAVVIKPDFAEAYFNQGNILQELKDFGAAAASYDKAIAIKPDYYQAYTNRGKALLELQRHDAALASHDRAIAIKPDYHEAFANRGNALLELKQLDAALDSYDKAIAIKPDYHEVFSNRGVLLMELFELDAALDSFDRAIAIKPDYHEARLHKSLALLLGGNFKNGWELYESRWNVDKFTSPRRNFSQPLWLGNESLDGKTILLHSEQGLGDTIQFSRYAPLVADLGARVIIEAEQSLAGLLEKLTGVSEVVTKGHDLPEFDYHCPLMSLPLAFKTDLGNIPCPEKYLKSEPGKLAYWNTRLGPKTKPRIGLVWSGSNNNAKLSHRRLSLNPAIRQLPPGFQYVSLQTEVWDVDKSTLESANNIIHFGDELKDFTDTAALCDLMDIVISVDTSVAHLSGALGKPTWVLLAFSPEWRWMLGRDDSPWYRSLRLFRQESSGDWSGVLKKLNAELNIVYERNTESALLDTSTIDTEPEDNPAGFDSLTTQGKRQFQQAFALFQQGQLARAQALNDGILKSRPEHVDALHLSGVIAYQTRKYLKAVDLISKAIAINPDNPELFSNMGLALHELMEFEAALASYDQAITLKPDFAQAYYNRGITLQKQKKLEDALASYDRAIAFNPGYHEAFHNRGVALKEMTQLDAAIAGYDKCIAINPGYHEAYVHKSITLLLGGNFREGWELYEWRWKVDKFTSPKRNFSPPLWLGEQSLAGKTILLHSEQGLGDTIQFCRYALSVADLGAKVVLEVELPLVGLLKELNGVTEIVAKGSELPAFDYHCPLLSLPLAFKTDLSTIPCPHQYLGTDPGKRVYWKNRLGQETTPRVGLVWSGLDAHTSDGDRSIPLSVLIGHLPSDFTFVSLQKEVRDSDRPTLASNANILHFGDELNDFTDTAALCELMDVVISVDTSVAHLNGALGNPTWVLLPFCPDWRWLLDRDDSPWYPGMRLFRQVKIGDWAGVLEKLKSELITAYGR